MQGLWTAEFGSSIGSSGGGVIFLSDGKVRGGDGAYYYVGTYEVVGKEFSVEVKISPYLPSSPSVFNTIGKEFSLVVRGSFTDDTHAIAQGHAIEFPGIALGIKLTRQV